ncbi:MAG: hypothetical protein RBT34_09965 [Anaerolineaceae bacterium]|jgi:hypothetical protein|nr:hypothetical protein [Anaerolineaceae bacterium]
MDRYWQQPSNEYRRRAFQSLDEAEESQRASLKQKYEDLQEVLIQLAHVLRGEAIEKARHGQPQAPHNWTPSDWRNFWFEETRIVSPVVAKTWKEIAKEEAEKNPATLGMPAYNLLDVHRALQGVAHVDDMRRAMEAAAEVHRGELERKNEHIAGLEKKLGDLQAIVKNKNLTIGTAATVDSVGNTETIKAASRGAEEAKALSSSYEKELALWKTVPVASQFPEEWKKQLSMQQTPSRVETAFEILFALYSCGISCKVETEWLVSLIKINNPAANQKSTNRLMLDMVKDGLLEDYNIYLAENGVGTHVYFHLLTQKGKQLCEALGLPAPIAVSAAQQTIDNGFDREDDRVQMLLAISFYASLRKWECENIQKDFSMPIHKGDSRYVVVALTRMTSDVEVQNYLKSIKEEDTPTGIVAISPGRRISIEKWCKENITANIAFTDIKHLIDKEPDTEKIIGFSAQEYVDGLPLWLE